MPERAKLWRLRARSLKKARAAFRNGDPEGLHDVRVALRRAAATAAALGKEKVAEKSKDLVRRLSDRRQLEVDRELLARIGSLGLLSPEAAAALDAEWDGLLRKGEAAAARVADGGKIRKLEKRLARLARSQAGRVVAKLERAWREARTRLAKPPDGKNDREIHRYRLAIKRARYIAEDLATCDAPGFTEEAARAKAVQEALGNWNDLRLFRERLEEAREQAEERGAISLAAELVRLLSILEGTLASTRQEALRAAWQMSNVFPLMGRTA